MITSIPTILDPNFVSFCNWILGVSEADKQLILDEHNRLRAGVQPAARNMQKMVNIQFKISNSL